MKYYVRVIEKRSKIIVVGADDVELALAEAQQAYQKGQIVLTEGEYAGVDFNVVDMVIDN